MPVKRPKKPTCHHKSPLPDGGYVAVGEAAEKLLAAGWRQARCPTCGLYAIWLDPKDSRAGRAAVDYVEGKDLDEMYKMDAYADFYAGWDAADAARRGAP
jgi:hypothetical protein